MYRYNRCEDKSGKDQSGWECNQNPESCETTKEVGKHRPQSKKVKVSYDETFKKKLDAAMENLVDAWDFSRKNLDVNDSRQFTKTSSALEEIFEAHNIPIE